jgi:uncharacterized protein with HEPN domain
VSRRHWRDRVRDVLSAIDEIESFTSGMSFEAYSQDIRTIRAVQASFMIICEAVTALPEEIQNRHPNLPWRDIRAMRNRLVHVYFNIDQNIVWQTIQDDLPVLKAAMHKLAMLPDEKSPTSD